MQPTKRRQMAVLHQRWHIEFTDEGEGGRKHHDKSGKIKELPRHPFSFWKTNSKVPSTDIKDHQCKIPHIQLNSALARSQKSSKRAIETRLKVGRKLQHALKNNKERKKERRDFSFERKEQTAYCTLLRVKSYQSDLNSHLSTRPISQPDWPIFLDATKLDDSPFQASDTGNSFMLTARKPRGPSARFFVLFVLTMHAHTHTQSSRKGHKPIESSSHIYKNKATRKNS